MTQLVTIDHTQFGLEESKANEMVSGLNPILSERTILSQIYSEVITKELNQETLKEAKELRIKIRDNRTKGIEVWHKANKEFYLRGGQFVDAIRKREVIENERMEDVLEQIEKHFENIEKERQNALHLTRIELIKPYVEDLTALDFRTMQDDVFEAYLTAKKQAYEARIEAERIAEEKRMAEIEAEKQRIEAQRIENERLKAEAEAKEKELEAERKKAEAEKSKQQAILDAERKKADELLEAQRKQAEAERKKQDDIIAKQKAENDRIQAELKAKQDAEIAEQKRVEAESKKALKAPDKQKLKTLVSTLKIEKLELKSDESNAVFNVINEKFEAFKTWANNQIESL